MSIGPRIVIGNAERPRYPVGMTYTDRATKAQYIAGKYAAILAGSVLDVGCDQAPLRALVGDRSRYFGVDIDPAAADMVVDLDRQDLPFGERSYDTVVCTDVLEHLERCHAVFDRMCEIAIARVLVSLPNPLNGLLDSMQVRSEGWRKFYGLPVDPPRDRHRWFFGFEDARRFLEERGRRKGFAIEQLDVEYSSVHPWKDAKGVDVLDRPDTRHGILWCVLRRAE